MTAVIASGALLLATGAWTIAIAVDLPGRSATALVLVSASLWTATVVAVVGILISHSRWARRLGMVVCGAEAGLALVRPADGWWWAALVLTMLAALMVAGPWMAAAVGSRPASGPPPRTVLVPLILVGMPYLLGIGGSEQVPGAVVGTTALVAAFWFIRAMPGALAVVRLAWPVLALALAWPMGGWLVRSLAAVGAVVVATLSWHPSVTRAVKPLVERGTRIPIPPELAPGEVLDAASLDDRGRRRP